jgi:hypothetical protein
VERSKNGSDVGLQVAEDVGELKAHLSERIRALREHRRPLVVTQSGRAAAAMLSPKRSID